MTMPFNGVLSAIITPFTPDGSGVDVRVLREHVERQIADGVDGFVPCGGTGEFSMLSDDERRLVIETVCEQVAGRADVLAHTGAMTTRSAIALSRHAEGCGATGIMLATPYYDPLTLEQAYAYYADVASATSLPICAYNYPPATGLHLGTEFLVRLATEIDQVQYVKDSSADLTQLTALALDHADTILVLCGEESLLLEAFLLGAHGMVMGAPNFLAPAIAQMAQAAGAGDVASLVDLWRQLLPVLRFLGGKPFVSAVKTACDILGHPAGPVRAPLPSLPDADREELARLIRRLDPKLPTAKG
jgi:4-hydroxy-tetrahydrodipicolinate synthase